MATTDVLGERGGVELAAGRLEFRSAGSGPPVVFVHGAAVNGDLWRKVVPEMARDHRCIVPDLPLGAHRIPLNDDADLSLYGVAGMLADALSALDLQDVTLVGNDTGGAVCQALVGRFPERIGRLVLTSCDAFENFPPKAVAYLKPLARVPPAFWLLTQAVRFRPVQRLPVTYGWATRAPIDPAVMASFVTPMRTTPGVRRDFMRMLRAADRRDTLRAAEELRGFDRPALVAWAAEDRFFPREHGKRLARLLPQGDFALVERSRTFIPEDNPGRLLELLRAFLDHSRRPRG